MTTRWSFGVAALAQADIAACLNHTFEEFGERARTRYERLIATALADLREDPLRPTSLDRFELAEGVRTYHLMCCRRRAAGPGGMVARPRHTLVYEINPPGRILVLRLAHDAMDLDRLIPRADPSSD